MEKAVIKNGYRSQLVDNIVLTESAIRTYIMVERKPLYCFLRVAR